MRVMLYGWIGVLGVKVDDDAWDDTMGFELMGCWFQLRFHDATSGGENTKYNPSTDQDIPLGLHSHSEIRPSSPSHPPLHTQHATPAALRYTARPPASSEAASEYEIRHSHPAASHHRARRKPPTVPRPKYCTRPTPSSTAATTNCYKTTPGPPSTHP